MYQKLPILRMSVAVIFGNFQFFFIVLTMIIEAPVRKQICCNGFFTFSLVSCRYCRLHTNHLKSLLQDVDILVPHISGSRCLQKLRFKNKTYQMNGLQLRSNIFDQLVLCTGSTNDTNFYIPYTYVSKL